MRVAWGRARRRPRTVALACAAAVVWVLVAAAVAAAAPEATLPPEVPEINPSGTAPLLLVLDASGSMNADDGTGRPKIEAAKEALRTLVAELPEATLVGLRVYGHRTTNADRVAGCADTELVVPVAPLDRPAMLAAFDRFAASGFTPIGISLRAALGDLPGDGPRTVVLVSDGVDTCAPPDPCDVARELHAADVQLRIETIGFQVDPVAAEQLRCIAEVTGGQFRPAEDAEDLLRALREYAVSGTLVDCAPTPADAPVIGSGQYLDTITVGETRWCAVELGRGELLRTVATIVAPRPDDGSPGPVAPEATFSVAMRTDDILGASNCASDEVTRIGQEARQVSADGLTVAEGLCAEPGRYVIGLTLEDAGARRPEDSVLAGITLDIELIVSVVFTGAPALVTPTPDDPAGVLAADQPLPREPIPGSNYLIAAAVGGVLGLAVGVVASRRFGP